VSLKTSPAHDESVDVMTDKTPTRPAQRRPRSTAPAKKTVAEKKEPPARSLPVLVPEVHVRHLPLPRVDVGHVPVPRVHLPMPDAVRNRMPEHLGNRALWLGGLAGLAALGVIDWPVAGVVAAGTYVATRRARAAAHEELEAAQPAGTR
jgi:hypothetical protein